MEKHTPKFRIANDEHSMFKALDKGKYYGKSTTEISFDLLKGETRMFKL